MLRLARDWDFSLYIYSSPFFWGFDLQIQFTFLSSLSFPVAGLFFGHLAGSEITDASYFSPTFSAIDGLFKRVFSAGEESDWGFSLLPATPSPLLFFCVSVFPSIARLKWLQVYRLTSFFCDFSGFFERAVWTASSPLRMYFLLLRQVKTNDSISQLGDVSPLRSFSPSLAHSNYIRLCYWLTLTFLSFRGKVLLLFFGGVFVIVSY